MMEVITRDLCEVGGVPYVSLPGQLLNHGWWTYALPPTFSDLFVERGYCYGGFRNMPRKAEAVEPIDIPILGMAPKVVLVRDPRDMLVSHYFSFKASHPDPKSDERTWARDEFDAVRADARSSEIEAYVMKLVEVYQWEFGVLESVIAMDSTLLLRYEDVLYDKPGMTRRLRDHLQIPASDEQVAEIAARHDTIPEAEQPDQHIRKAHPGDHKEKLSAATIEKLNEAFAPVLDRYGYER